eukprot:2707234-Lingulodinium_polyedra.AAC.1
MSIFALQSNLCAHVTSLDKCKRSHQSNGVPAYVAQTVALTKHSKSSKTGSNNASMRSCHHGASGAQNEL